MEIRAGEVGVHYVEHGTDPCWYSTAPASITASLRLAASQFSTGCGLWRIYPDLPGMGRTVAAETLGRTAYLLIGHSAVRLPRAGDRRETPDAGRWWRSSVRCCLGGATCQSTAPVRQPEGARTESEGIRATSRRLKAYAGRREVVATQRRALVSLVSIPASQIDRIGIDPANAACLERALRALGERAELCLVDGDGRRPLGASALVHEWIPQGDGTSATIAAASIVAKVARDRLMARLGERYPDYGFERHKGYGTPEHMAAIAKLRPTPEHRLSFNARRFADAVVAAPARRRKQSRPAWRELPAAEMAAHLLETPTIGDRVWTEEPRLPRETRTAFIRRVLLGEREPVEAPEGENAATETASTFAERPEDG